MMRRSSPAAEQGAVVTVGELQIDTQARQASLGGKAVHLTTSEYRILFHLAKNPGRAFSRADMLAVLWEESPVGDERAIDVHIHNMREKLETDPKNPEYLLTVRGFGYRLKER